MLDNLTPEVAFPIAFVLWVVFIVMVVRERRERIRTNARLHKEAVEYIKADVEKARELYSNTKE